MPKVTKTCLYCGNNFQTWPCRVGKYCSRRCSRRDHPERNFTKIWQPGVPVEARKRQAVKMRQYRGENCWNWKPWGQVSLRAKHRKVSIIRGNPSKCEHCGDKAVEWASKDHRYLDPNDFIALCRKCHMNYDFKMGFRSSK